MERAIKGIGKSKGERLMSNTVNINEWKRPVNQDIVKTIEETIHDKINTLKADFRQPWCIILNEEAYLALCYAIQKISGTLSFHLEQYRGLIVILDRTSIDAIKVLQNPFDELTIEKAKEKER